MEETTPTTRWLTDDEQAAWRGLQRMQAQLSGALGRALAEDAGLSLADYAVLVELSDAPDGRLRPFELGRALGWEKSRLSHHLARMVGRGLVGRERCPSDQRGLLLALTPEGRTVLERAAPGHVAAVRRAFVDRLTPEQLATVAEVARTVVDGLSDVCEGAAGSEEDDACPGEDGTGCRGERPPA